MYPMSAALEAALGTSHDSIAEIIPLDSNLEQVADAIPLEGFSGSVTSEWSAPFIRRDFRIQIANPDAAHTPSDPDVLTFPFKMARLERAAIFATFTERIPLVTGRILDPIAVRSPDGREVSLSGTDRLSLLDVSSPDPWTLAPGTPGAVALRDVFEAAGAGEDDALYELDDGDEVHELGRIWAAETTWLERARDIATDLSLIIEGHALGPLRCFPAPTTDDILLTITEELIESVRYAVSGGEWYNRAIVETSGTTALPYRAERRNLDPDSPGFNPIDPAERRADFIGDRAAPIRHTAGMTPTQADRAALQYLREVSAVAEQLDLDLMTVSALVAFDPIRISVPADGIDATYRAIQVQQDLAVGTRLTVGRTWAL
jgi:hypothetical protein